ncbi:MULTISPECIES: H-NS histone family protein [unclassified Caballeronia]|uniref:H-NS histone family protein n=1 Tax=unclassified Caballeronia TaxID=2646786 RepID=UPI0032EACFAE
MREKSYNASTPRIDGDTAHRTNTTHMAYQNPEITRLVAQQQALERQLNEAKEQETQLVLKEIVQKMRQYGISLNELFGPKSGAQRADAPAKYRDPVSGATWSGRGRAPQWIAGKDRDEFLVDKGENVRAMVQAALFPEKH